MVKQALGASHRDAIAMIELIFAIVIMGIVLMSAPMLISRANQSNITAFQQESIAILSSHINALTTYHWDEANTISDQEGNILMVENGYKFLEQKETVRGTTDLDRPRRRTFGKGIKATVIGHDNDEENDFNDIDDFHKATRELHLYTDEASLTNKGEYIDQNIIIRTEIGYIKDTAKYNAKYSFTFNLKEVLGKTDSSTNIKHIITTLTSKSPDNEIADKRIVLHAFMCNIGATAPLIKSGI